MNILPPGCQLPDFVRSKLSDGIDGNSDSFSDLLAAMDAAPVTIDKAAAIDPAVGSHPHSFEQATLLTTTSCEVTEPGLQPAAESPPDPPVGVAGRIGDWLDALGSNLAAGPDDLHTSQRQQLLGAMLSRPDGTTLSIGVRAAEEVPRTIDGSDTPRPLMAAAALVQGSNVPIAARPDTPAPVQRSAGAPLAPPPPGHFTPFSAVLLSVNGGMRLIVRAPSLGPGEGDELERLVRSLFADRGLAEPEFVLRTIRQPRAGEPR